MPEASVTPVVPDLGPLTTARLHIRVLEPADLDDLAAVNGDEAVVSHLPYPAWRTQADAQAWLGRMQALQATGTARQYVLARTTDGLVVGSLLLFRYEEAAARAELGYVLGRAHWGQGLMREALHAVCDAAFTRGGLRRLEAEVRPDNTASSRLLDSLGFTPEGLLRQRWQAKGVAYDVQHWGLLAGELRPAR